ncbi:MAG: Arc family DNA-binding protein [Chloroflexi bacterium]|nr:Arc family DNA-binding protein [Chloroflexota bacterium]
MAEMVKLTLRLPIGLHKQLRERAEATKHSLNAIILESLRQGLRKETTYQETEREKVLRVLRESGLLEPLGSIWDEEIAKAPDITYDELWREMEGVPPLSEVIIAERGPR